MKLNMDFIKKIDGGKAFGIAATVVGLVATYMNNEAEKKALDQTVEKKVAEKLAEMQKKDQ